MIDSRSPATRAYFVIWGRQCDPHSISAGMAVVASQTWRVGDIRNARTGAQHEDGGWRIDSDGAPHWDPGTHLGRLLEMLWPARDYLRSLAPTCEMQFSVVIHCHEASAPPMYFSRDLLQRIASLNAAIDVDLYPS